MQTIHVLTGLPGSGKSTFARSLIDSSANNIRRVNLDDIRNMLDTGASGERSRNLSRGHEKTALEIQDATVRAALDNGFDVVVDNTHLRPSIPKRLKAIAGGDAVFEVHDFTHIPVEECIRRDALRTGIARVGEEIIRKMAEGHAKVRKSGWRLTSDWMNDRIAVQPYTADTSLPTAIVCDIDGTLALMNSGRGPYEWHRVGEDELNWPVYAALSALYETYDDRIILLSGRDGSCREQTERWLKDNDVFCHELHMRAPNDHRPDDIVKAELFDKHIRHQFNVRLVLDDRDKVVALWRRMGLPTWQVNYGNF